MSVSSDSARSTTSSSRTRRLLVLVVLVAVIGGGGAWWLSTLGSEDSKPKADASGSTAAEKAAGAEQFAGLRTYVDDHTARLVAATGDLDAAATAYAAVVAEHDGDYAAVAAEDAEAVRAAITDAREAFTTANPAYEEMEGVVAGVPSLAKYDVSIDAGAPAIDGPDGAVEFDVVVSDTRTLERPGNYFLLAESTLWSTNEAYSSGTPFDVDGDGATTEFGDVLPDAEVLAAVTRDFSAEAAKLEQDAAAWTPTTEDAFTALVVMTPTMGEYFGSWKNSRFVAGDKATEQGFVSSSRLADVVGILTGLEVIRASLEDEMVEADPAAAASIERDLAALTTFVDDIRTEEAAGKRFTAAEADRLGADAQAQAEQVTARVSDIARQLGVEVAA